MTPSDSTNASGEGQESVCPGKDLELLTAGAKQVLVTGALDKGLVVRPEDA